MDAIASDRVADVCVGLLVCLSLSVAVSALCAARGHRRGSRAATVIGAALLFCSVLEAALPASMLADGTADGMGALPDGGMATIAADMGLGWWPVLATVVVPSALVLAMLALVLPAGGNSGAAGAGEGMRAAGRDASDGVAYPTDEDLRFAYRAARRLLGEEPCGDGDDGGNGDVAGGTVDS